MCVRKEGDQLLRRNHRAKYDKNGPRKSKRGRELAKTANAHRSTTIPRVHRLLPILRPKLLKNRPTTPRFDEENDPLALGSTPRKSISGTKGANVLQPGPYPTRLQQKVLPTNRRVGIRR